MNYYLGPARDRWAPSSWADVISAAASGVLDETQWVELKAALPPSSKPANLELARDLASLAVDGGLLVVGIQDDNGAAGEAVGTELSGLAERIDQVSRDRVHPPLVVRPVEIVDPARPGVGCLLITVDASPEAPHMVDDRYWGRGATGKRVLVDSDVRRLLDLNSHRRADFLQLLSGYVASGTLRVPGSLHFLITPRAGRAESLQVLVEQPHRIQQMVEEVVTVDRTGWNLHALSYSRMTLRGCELSNVDLAAADAADLEWFKELNAKVLSVRDDGELASTVTTLVGTLNGEGEPVLWVSTKGVVALTRQLVRVAACLADEAAYGGHWDVGVTVTALRRAKVFGEHGPRNSPWAATYRDDTYTWVTETNTGELVERPDDVVTRLTSRLLQILGDLRQLGVQFEALI